LDPITLSIIVTAATFAAHLLAARITSKAPPTATDPTFPTTFGHGELIQFIRQEISNAIARSGGVPIPVAPVTPVAPLPIPVDFHAILSELIALLAKQIPQPVAPVVPVPTPK
jgi:hypothetical protein